MRFLGYKKEASEVLLSEVYPFSRFLWDGEKIYGFITFTGEKLLITPKPLLYEIF